MSEAIAFSVEGKPRGKQRHRTGFGGRTYTPKQTVAAERAIAWAYKAAALSRPLMTGTVVLKVEAIFEVPKSWPKKLRADALAGLVPYSSKPDKDNIEKLVLDALNGVAWVDDSQVQPDTRRRYGEPARLEVYLVEVKAAEGLKSPAERRREKKVAEGMTTPKQRKKRYMDRPSASALVAIGRRTK